MMFLLLACDPSTELQDFDGEALAAEFEGYEEWAELPGWEGITPSCDGTHGDYLQIWLNAVALADVDAGATTFSEGALWLHEGFQEAEGVSKGLTAMRKVTGFDPDGGDWFWGQYDTEGFEVQSGKIAGCAECHSEGTDFVRVMKLSPVANHSECLE